MNKKDRSEWLKAIREELGMSQKQLSTDLGIDQSTYSRIEKGGGRTNLTIEHLDKLVNMYNVNPHYLLNGREPYFLEEEHYPTGNTKGDFNATMVDIKYENLALFVPIKAQAGYVANWPDDNTMNLERVLIPGMNNLKARVFEVAGNSMYPVLLHGDYVACTPVNDRADLRVGLVYVIVSRTQGVTVKYVAVDDYALTCTPENLNDHQTFMIPFDEVQEMWEVRIRITRHVLAGRFSSEPMRHVSNSPSLEEIAQKVIEIAQNKGV